MSWDLKFTRDGKKALGTIAQVQSAILAVIPEVQFSTDPGGIEKVREIEAKGIELPEALRTFFTGRNRTTLGNCGNASFSMRFFIGSKPEIQLLHVAVNGDFTAARALLQQLAALNNWTLSNYAPSDSRNE